MEFLSKNLGETSQIVENFLEKLEKKTDKAVVVGLYGDLGSGKTAFVKEIAKILGMKEDITSPTFVIEKIYDLSGQKFGKLIHIDAYRLEEESEIVAIGWNEIISDSDNLIMIEWPEKVAKVLPEDMIKINFEFVDENARKIKF